MTVCEQNRIAIVWTLPKAQGDFENGLFNDRGKWSDQGSGSVSPTKILWLLNFIMLSARKIKIYKEEKKPKDKEKRNGTATLKVGGGVEVRCLRPQFQELCLVKSMVRETECSPSLWAWLGVDAFEKRQKWRGERRGKYRGKEVNLQLSRS